MVNVAAVVFIKNQCAVKSMKRKSKKNIFSVSVRDLQQWGHSGSAESYPDLASCVWFKSGYYPDKSLQKRGLQYLAQCGSVGQFYAVVVCGKNGFWVDALNLFEYKTHELSVLKWTALPVPLMQQSMQEMANTAL